MRIIRFVTSIRFDLINRVKGCNKTVFGLILLLPLGVFAEDCPQTKCLSGLTLLDSSVQVTGVVSFDKWIDLVEISTPSTPSSNHVKIWLRAEANNKQSIVATFDDGTTTRLTGN